MSIDRYGLVAHYQHYLTDGKLLDLSGKGNHGTINGATPTTDHNGRANRGWLFQNANLDYIDLGETVFLNTSNPFTLICSVKLTNYAAIYPILFSLKTNNTIFSVGLSNQTPYLGVAIGSSANWSRLKTNDPATLFTSQYNHIAVTYNGNGSSTNANFEIYVNGVKKTLTNSDNFGVVSSIKNTIGAHQTATTTYYTNGVINQAAIYNVAKSDSEIQKLYNYWRTH